MRIKTQRIQLANRRLPLSLVLGSVAGVALVALELVHPVYLQNLVLRVAVETTITLLALTGLGLWFTRYEQSRRKRDLAPLMAVGATALVDLTLFAFPTLMGIRAVRLNGYASLFGETLACASMVALAAAALAIRRRHPDRDPFLLVCAAVLLAATSLQYLSMPAAAVDWVTPLSGVRLIAYGLLLAGAIRQHLRARDYASHAALIAERERIARDLHDGLAQDLAFIAAYGSRLDGELGGDHPLVIAARRAVAASRGAIGDLSASAAPTTDAALRMIARELGRRYDVDVSVALRGDARREPSPRTREQLIRIAREAIVNAVKHGHARQVDVELELRGRQIALRITDDGDGIEERSADAGFGLPMMRARAESLGGELLARRRPHGGTEVELLIP